MNAMTFSKTKLFEYEKTLSEKRVSMTPDLFLDHLIVAKIQYEDFIKEIHATFQRGGGNLFNVDQFITIGGNAANCARIIGSLGTPCNLIVNTSVWGKNFADFYFQGTRTQIITNPEDKEATLSITTALEVTSKDKKKKANIMLSSPGTLDGFDGSSYNTRQWEHLTNVHLIGIMNFVNNPKYPQLVKTIITHLEKKQKKPLLFLDVGDLSRYSLNSPEFNAFCEVLNHPYISYLSLNENEIRIMAKKLNVPFSLETLEKTTVQLSERYPHIKILVHTADLGIVAINGSIIATKNAFAINPIRLTGAGDTWNAGYIVGSFIGSDEEALEFAHKTAAFFLEKNQPPTLKTVLEYQPTEKST